MSLKILKKTLATAGVIGMAVLFSVLPSYASVKKPSYRYTYTFTGEKEQAGDAMPWAMTKDPAGNIYMAGAFVGTIDFNPTAGVDNKTSVGGWNAFLTKINADETYGYTYVWAHTDSIRGVATDSQGNVYLTGDTFSGSIDFDPTGGTDIKTTQPYNGTGFIMRINANATYGWTHLFVGTGFHYGYGTGATTDSDGNAYFIGTYAGNIDFNPDGGHDFINNGGGGYLTKINANGSYGGTRTVGGTPNGVTTDSNKNAYVTGAFSGTANFNRGGLGSDIKVSAGSSDIFLTKINADGSYGYARTYGGPGEDTGNAVTVDKNGTVYLTGYYGGNFTDTADFNHDGGGDVKISNGVFDVFLTKVNPDGSYGWTRHFGGAGYDYGNGLTTDADGNVYLSGSVDGITSHTINFDFTGGTDMQTVGGTDDGYLTVMNADGTYGYTYLFGGTRNDYTDDIFSEASVQVTADGIFVAGRFYGSDDFDPTSGTDIRQGHGYDMNTYLTKLNFPTTPPPPPPPHGGGGQQTGTITVVKKVVNDNGGAKTVSDFPLFVSGTPVVSDVANPFFPTAAYDITETGDLHYVRTFSGDCDINGRMKLDAGQDKVCTITNDDIVEPPVIPPPVVPPTVTPPVVVPPVVTPPPVVPPVSVACDVCAKLVYDVYIINPDGTERHTGTPWVRVTDRGNGVKRYAFEDATLDPKNRNYDYNDALVDVDLRDCTRVTFTFVSSDADWKHKIHVKVSSDGAAPSDLLLVNDSKAAVGTSKTVNAASQVKLGLACPVPVSACTTPAAFTHALALGSADAQVRPLQELLKCLSFFPADLATSDHFGSVTQSALKKFQSTNHLDPLGFVGPATRGALNQYMVK